MASRSGHLGLYWGVRREPVERCAAYVHDSLRALVALGYERYFFLGRSRRGALKRELDITPETVLAALAKGVNRTDIPRKPIPDLGWHIAFWSGGPDDEAYAISFHCGAYSDYVGNSVVMNLPPAGPFSIATAPTRALKAYEALVAIWSPEQAVLCEGSINWDERHRLVADHPPLAQHPALAE